MDNGREVFRNERWGLSFVCRLAIKKRNGMQRFDLSIRGGESTSISIRRNDNNTIGYYSRVEREVHGELGESGAPEGSRFVGWYDGKGRHSVIGCCIWIIG